MESRLPVPGNPSFWFKAARVSRLHDTCSPVDRRILYRMGLWASKGWPVTVRMYRAASRALRRLLEHRDAAREWLEDLDEEELEHFVDAVSQPVALDTGQDAGREDEPAGPGTRHAVCGHCGSAWSFAPPDSCPQCGVIASRVWWFEEDGRITEAWQRRRRYQLQAMRLRQAATL